MICQALQPKASEARTTAAALTINSVIMNDIKRSEITEEIYDDVMLMTDTVEMDRGERVEMMVDIYDSADTERHLDLRTNTERHPPLQHTGNVIHLKHIMTDKGIVVSLAFFSVALVYFFIFFTFSKLNCHKSFMGHHVHKKQLLTQIIY